MQNKVKITWRDASLGESTYDDVNVYLVQDTTNGNLAYGGEPVIWVHPADVRIIAIQPKSTPSP